MKLRPHHLLCTQAFEGMGYSKEFIDKMDYITNILKNTENPIVNIIFSTDDICHSCPNMLGIDLCVSNNKVKYIDSKVIEYFNLTEKEYNYNDIVKLIKNNITEEVMDDICGNCNWYSTSNCKNIICDNK